MPTTKNKAGTKQDALARSVRVAQSAAPETERLVREARERRAEAERQVHRDHFDELYRERERLFERRDGLGADLAAVLEEGDRLTFEMQKTMNSYDQPAANAMSVNGLGATRAWIEQTFGGWIR